MLMQLTRLKISRPAISQPATRKVPGPMANREKRLNAKGYRNVSAFLMFLAMLGWFGRDGRRIESLPPDIVVAIFGCVFLGICVWVGSRRESPGDRHPNGTKACAGSGTVQLERERVSQETKLRHRKLVLRTTAVAAAI